MLLTSLTWTHRKLALKNDRGNHFVLSLHTAAEKTEALWDKLPTNSNSKYVFCTKILRNVSDHLRVKYHSKLSIHTTVCGNIHIFFFVLWEKKLTSSEGGKSGSCVGEKFVFLLSDLFMTQRGLWQSLSGPRASRVNQNSASPLRRPLLLFRVTLKYLPWNLTVTPVQRELGEILGLPGTGETEAHLGEVWNGREQAVVVRLAGLARGCTLAGLGAKRTLLLAVQPKRWILPWTPFHRWSSSSQRGSLWRWAVEALSSSTALWKEPPGRTLCPHLKSVSPFKLRKMFSVLLAKLSKLPWAVPKEEQESGEAEGTAATPPCELVTGQWLWVGEEGQAGRARTQKESSDSGVAVVKFTVNVPNLWLHESHFLLNQHMSPIRFRRFTVAWMHLLGLARLPPEPFAGPGRAVPTPRSTNTRSHLHTQHLLKAPHRIPGPHRRPPCGVQGIRAVTLASPEEATTGPPGR